MLKKRQSLLQNNSKLDKLQNRRPNNKLLNNRLSKLDNKPLNKLRNSKLSKLNSKLSSKRPG